MITYLSFSALCLAVFYAGWHVYLRRESEYRLARLYLLVSLAVSLLLPAVRFSVGEVIQPNFFLEPVLVGLQAADQQFAVSRGATNWAPVFLGLYILGAVGATFRLVASIVKIRRIGVNGEWKTFEGHRYFQTTKNHPPFSFLGTIYISGLHPIGPVDLRHVLRHERVHTASGHSYDRLFLEILLVLFWFNPLLYLYRKAIMNIHEFAADQQVLTGSITRGAYLKTLLGRVTPGQVPQPAHAFFQPQLNIRIMKLTQVEKRNGKWKFLLFLPLLCAVAGIVACKEESGIGNTDLQEAQTTAALTDDRTDNDDVLLVAEVMPGFPGCPTDEGEVQKQKCTSTQLGQFIGEQLKYPKEAEKAGIEGKVVISFVVDKSGYISDIDIVKDIGYGCGEEALRVLKSINEMEGKWSQGMQSGKVVSVKYTLPILFALDEDKK